MSLRSSQCACLLRTRLLVLLALCPLCAVSVRFLSSGFWLDTAIGRVFERLAGGKRITFGYLFPQHPLSPGHRPQLATGSGAMSPYLPLQPMS